MLRFIRSRGGNDGGDDYNGNHRSLGTPSLRLYVPTDRIEYRSRLSVDQDRTVDALKELKEEMRNMEKNLLLKMKKMRIMLEENAKIAQQQRAELIKGCNRMSQEMTKSNQRSLELSERLIEVLQQMQDDEKTTETSETD